MTTSDMGAPTARQGRGVSTDDDYINGFLSVNRHRIDVQFNKQKRPKSFPSSIGKADGSDKSPARVGNSPFTFCDLLAGTDNKPFIRYGRYRRYDQLCAWETSRYLLLNDVGPTIFNATPKYRRHLALLFEMTRIKKYRGI